MSKKDLLRAKRCYCIEDGAVTPYRSGGDEVIRAVVVYPLKSADQMDVDIKGAYTAPVFKCSVCNEEYMTRIYAADDLVVPRTHLATAERKKD